MKTLYPNPVSKKCEYGLRAMFELAFRDSAQPVTVQDIAAAQRIPWRFLEVILGDLKRGGFVEARRGNDGGYVLAEPPHRLIIGDVVSFLQGRPRADAAPSPSNIDRPGDFAFGELWDRLRLAVEGVYNATTFADLVAMDLANRASYVANYMI